MFDFGRHFPHWRGRQFMENRFEKIVKDIFSFTQFVPKQKMRFPPHPPVMTTVGGNWKS